MLERFAALLVKNFRDSDVVARFGGDEFCVLSSYTTTAMTKVSLQRLDEAFSASAIALEYPMLSWSAGVAEYDPSQAPSLEELLNQADAKMFEAKQALAKPAARASSRG